MNHRSSWRFFLLVPAMALAFAAGAQSNEPDPAVQSFTLEECIDYALKNAVAAKNATLDEQIAEARVKETVGIGLPQISGSATVMHNQQLQRFFGTYEENPEGGFSFFPPGIPGAQDGDVLAAQNFFQLKNSGDISLAASQLIFSGSYLVGLQAASTYRELATKSKQQTQEQIIEQVTKAYYSVLINRERLELFNNNIARIDTLLNNTRALAASGFAERIDVDRVQVAYNNLIAERDKFVKLNELSQILLKFQMNYPLDGPVAVSGNIAEIEVAAELDEYRDGWNYKERTDYQLLEVNKSLQQLNIKNLYAGKLPTLAAFANLGYATQSNTFGGLFSTNSNVEDNGTIGPDKWYRYTNFGLSLTVPIFSGLQGSYQLQQQKLNLLKIENNFDMLTKAIDLEIAQATTNYQNALKSLQSQRENQELASNIARVTKIKYEEGVGSNLEVVDAESALKEAQVNYYNALFEAMVAKVDLEKAFGKLNPATSEK